MEIIIFLLSKRLKCLEVAFNILEVTSAILLVTMIILRVTFVEPIIYYLIF